MSVAAPELLLASWRSLLGESTVLWAGEDGLTLRPDRWVALSGARSVAYNAALVHGDARALERTLDEVSAARVPAVVAVAGAALGEVELLTERRWRCIGSTPLMVCELAERAPAGAPIQARRLAPHEHLDARELIGDVYDVGPRLAGIGIAGAMRQREGHSLWGAFDGSGELASCLAAVRVGDALAIWSMATRRTHRRRGFGAAALDAALADAAASGATVSILSSSAEGEPMYRALGYRELERWQQWSRPRWVLGRA